MSNLLQQLNTSQQQVVLIQDRPVAIIAGPGTGKTKTLTTKIMHLLQQNIQPEQILGLTFTRKAANEMRQRLQTAYRGTVPLITTFHGLAFRTLAQQQQITLISEEQRLQFIQEISTQQKYQNETNSREISLNISKIKNSLTPNPDNPFMSLFEKYQSLLSSQQLMDFDDLLLQLYQKYTQTPTALPQYAHILVDEFQDTNELQYQLLKRLSSTNNITVIGDPYQSIYSFRGSSENIFQQFQQDFPESTQIILQQNYRSVPQVVSFSKQLFPELQIQPVRTEKGKVQIIQTVDQFSEADWIVRDIQQKTGGTDLLTYNNAEGKLYTLKDFAIIYRTHHLALPSISRLKSASIPFQLAAEESIYQTKEIQLIVSVFKFLDAPTIQTYLTFLKLAQKELAKEMAEMLKDQNDQDWIPLFSDSSLAQIANRELKQKIERLLTEFREQNNLPISQITQQLTTQLPAIIPEFESNAEALKEFQGNLLQYDNHPDGRKQFLEWFETLRQNDYQQPDKECVTLLTIHAAKGLEFKNVYILACEDGHIPKIRQGFTNESEEKRLLYVAATRTIDNLTMLHTQNRYQKPAQLSRFLDTSQSQQDQAFQKIINQRKKQQQKKSQLKLF